MAAASAEYFIGIDVGTTHAKVVLIDDAARVVRSAVREYPVRYPRPGWAEQEPAAWWSAVEQLLAQVLAPFEQKRRVRALCVGGQMHGLVALDAKQQVIRPAILWNDQRAHRQSQAIVDACGGLEGVLRLTNNHVPAGYTAPKILWLRENEPESLARIDRVLLPKDYIRFRLTGEMSTDVSDASGTGLFDVARRRWSTELLEKLDLPVSWFPIARESIEVAGSLRGDLASRFGLDRDLPVLAGGGDAVMQPLGSGLLDQTEGLLVIGTGGNVTVPLAANLPNDGGRLQVFCGILPGSYVAMGATLAAGESLRWLRNLLRDGLGAFGVDEAAIDFAQLDRLAGQSAPGANRTLFLPYLLGERCPHPDADARGAFLGLAPSTKLGDLARAVMEGVAFSLRDVAIMLERKNIRPGGYRLSGGGSQSALWRRIVADVFACPVSTVAASSEGTAFAAALLAGMSCGHWPQPDTLRDLLPPLTVDRPEPENAPRYRALFDVYRQGYSSLCGLYRDLAAYP